MTGPSRDRAIERLLAVPARRPSQDATGPCVDAETVATWVDGGVIGAAADRFEAHVAACGSCQELLATVVRMMPLEAPVLQAVPRRPWTAWALPLAAAAVLVLVVWTTWPGSSRSAAPSALKEESRMARAEPPAAPSAVPQSGEPLAAPADAVEFKAPPAPAAPQVAPRSGTTSPPAVANRAASRPFASAPAPPPPAERNEREVAQGLPDRQIAKTEGNVDSLADKSAGQRKAEGEANAVAPPAPSAPVPAPAAEAAAPRADAPAQAAAGEARARRAGDVAALAASSALRDAAAARVTVQAAGAIWRWRVSRVLEYSSNGGATWRPSPGATAAQAADILAGASPMPPAAWMVGRRGLVLVTVDGMRFEVRTPPAMVDLVMVQTSDPQTAVVRGAAGEGWRTADGGRTWIAVASRP